MNIISPTRQHTTILYTLPKSVAARRKPRTINDVDAIIVSMVLTVECTQNGAGRNTRRGRDGSVHGLGLGYTTVMICGSEMRVV